MRKFTLTISVLLFVMLSQAQPWSYDFGTLTTASGGYTNTNQGSSVNLVMPFGPTIGTLTPLQGNVTNYVRIGTGGGSVNLENQAITFGSSSYLRAVAPTGASYNFMKFSGMAPATNQLYLSFKLRLGKSDGTSDAAITTGTWNMAIGNNFSSTNYAYYSGSVAPSGDAACNLQWSFGASGALTFKAGGSAGTTTTYSGITFTQATDYTIEIYVNNSNQTTAYSKSSTNYALTANTYDVWATPVSTGVAAKVNSSNIPVQAGCNSINGVLDSWLFYGASSTGNAANIFLDDFTYSNALPAAPTVTNYYYGGTGNLDVLTNWTINADGSGAGTPANNPTSFTANYQVFNIRNATAATIGSSWTVSGSGSKIVAGDGTNTSNFTVPTTFTVTGLVDVANNATLTLQNNTTPSLGTLNIGSTVVYDGPGTQTVQSDAYGTLTFSNTTIGGIPIRIFDTKGPVEIGTAFNVGSFTYAATAGANNFSYGTATTGGIVLYGTGNISLPSGSYPNILITNPNVTIAGNISFPASGTSGGLCNIYNNVTFPAGKTLTYISTAGATAGLTVAYNKTLSFAGAGSALTNTCSSITGSVMGVGAVTISSNNNTYGAMSFASGSQFTLAGTAGLIPKAAWSAGSTCIVSGITTSTSAIGNATQTFSNFTWNCASQTTGTASMAGATINGILNVSAGTLTTGGNVTIAPGAAIASGYANISGAVTLQQNIVGQRGWRVFANPFSTAQTIATVASNNAITIGNTVPTSGITDTRTFSSNVWNNVTGTTLAANTPYALFIRGKASEVTGSNYTGGPTAFTYGVSGTLNTTNSITPANTTDFIIVGNPYAAPVNTQALTGGTSAPYYTYQIAVTGTPQVKAGSWVASGSNSSTTATIPVLGVLAYQPASTSPYTIATTDINTTGTLQTGLFGVNDNKQLELLVEKNGDFQDKLFVRLDAAAKADGNDQNDLKKFYNDNVNVYTKSADGKNLAIDARNAITTIPVGISALTGDYNFKVPNNNLPTGSIVYLEDKFLNTQTEFKAGTTYNFSITSDAASKGENRFVLNFTQKTVAADNSATGNFTAKVLGNVTHGNTVMVQVSGSTTPVSISVIDLSGKTLKTVNAVNGLNIIDVSGSTGLQLLQINNGKTTITEKVIKQ